jgi:acetylglutamate kinase
VRLLVKIGGAQLERDDARTAVARALAAAREAGHEPIVVHGGGNQIRELCGRLGLEERYHRGLRVTDAATADVVLMVLGGLVNRQLVLALEREGLRAAGLTGADGGTFAARRHRPGGVDLGFVGEVAHVDPRLVEALLRERLVPVLATVAPEAAARIDQKSLGHPSDTFLNVNADMAAGPLAQAFGADALLFLTDVPGVLDAQQRLLPALAAADAERLRAAGVIAGGMVPKVEAALAAVRAAPRCVVKIAPAAGDDAVLAALRDEVGTRIHDGATTHG